MRHASGLRANLLLALASALLTLVLFVLGYEAWQTAKYRAWRARYDNKGWLGTLTVPSSDPVLMWEYKPHGSHRGIETNRYGFRERDFDSPGKPAGTYRVAFVGDSVTLGLGVQPEQTFERLVEQEARTLAPEPPLQALNFGVDGYNTTQVAELLKTRVRAFEPDLVVYVMCLNDFDQTDSSAEKIRYFRRPSSFFLEDMRVLYRRARGIEFHRYHFEKNRASAFADVLAMKQAAGRASWSWSCPSSSRASTTSRPTRCATSTQRCWPSARRTESRPSTCCPRSSARATMRRPMPSTRGTCPCRATRWSRGSWRPGSSRDRMTRVRLDSRAIERARRHLGGCTDVVMARLSKQIGAVPMGVRRGGSAFAYLSRAILAQQISTAAARSIGQRMTDRWGWPWRPEQVLAASDDEMRALGLSRQKASYLRDLAAHTQNGLPLHRLSRMTDERVIETLTVVKGIGRWTAEMYLMFRLGRGDVLPGRRPRDPLRDAARLRDARLAQEGAHAAHGRGVAAVPLDRVLLPLDEPRQREEAEATAEAASQVPLIRSLRGTRGLPLRVESKACGLLRHSKYWMPRAATHEEDRCVV
jgi:DNA-3-methyladenine glycosylase II